MKTISKLFMAVALAGLIAVPAYAASTAPVAGTSEGTGTDFAVTDSLGQSYTIRSTAEIGLYAEAVAAGDRAVVTLYVTAVSTATAATLTVGGLVPGKVYHVYTGNDSTHAVIPAAADGTLSLAVNPQEEPPIVIKTWPSTKSIGGYLGGDCSLVGTWVAASKTCTLTADLAEAIVIADSGVTLDGAIARYKIDPGSNGTAVTITGKNNVTIRNLTIYSAAGATNGIWVTGTGTGSHSFINNTINNFTNGIYLNQASSNKVENNTISNCQKNIYLRLSSNNTVVGNTITGSSTIGIDVAATSPDNTFTANIITNNQTSGVSVGYGSTGNIFINNKFSNLSNATGTVTATWNGTQQPGTNIVAGPSLGGNFWGTPAGTGHSETCVDEYVNNSSPRINSPDGICDSSYLVSALLGTDQLPLALFSYVNLPPELAAIGNRSGFENELLSIQLSATDPEGDTLAFTAEDPLSENHLLPQGASFDGVTGLFEWTPNYSQAGSYPVAFCVTDSSESLGIDCETISISIGNVNRPPSIVEQGPFTIDEGQRLEFGLTVTDPDGDTIQNVYADYLTGLPAGASFNQQTAGFSWTPDNSQGGDTYTIKFCATDFFSGVGCTDVVITVRDTINDTLSPSELMDLLIKYVLDQPFPKELTNSYLANLKKVNFFVSKGSLGAAINQLQAFVHKTGQDYLRGSLSGADRDLMVFKAEEVIRLLSPR